MFRKRESIKECFEKQSKRKESALSRTSGKLVAAGEQSPGRYEVDVIHDSVIAERMSAIAFKAKYDQAGDQKNRRISDRHVDPQILYGQLATIQEQKWIDILQRDRMYKELKNLNERLDKLIEKAEYLAKY